MKIKINGISFNIKNKNKPIKKEILALLGRAFSGNEAKKAQPTTPTLEWSHTLLDGERVTYEAAEKAVAALGDGWRMPTRFELESLLDLSRHEPAIDTEKFPDTKSTWYWTSTPCAWNSSAVWVVGFDDGRVSGCYRNANGCVRAVRSGQ